MNAMPNPGAANMNAMNQPPQQYPPPQQHPPQQQYPPQQQQYPPQQQYPQQGPPQQMMQPNMGYRQPQPQMMNMNMGRGKSHLPQCQLYLTLRSGFVPPPMMGGPGFRPPMGVMMPGPSSSSSFPGRLLLLGTPAAFLPF